MQGDNDKDSRAYRNGTWASAEIGRARVPKYDQAIVIHNYYRIVRVGAERQQHLGGEG